MKSADKLENENRQKVHYLLIGKNFNKVLKKLDKELKFYRFEHDGKFKGNEIIYDIDSNLLSNAGLVISKQIDEGKSSFKVRKISLLPGGFQSRAQKFYLGECDGKEEPKDFPIQIAQAIENSFSTEFTIDLVSIVRKTKPKIEIEVKGNRYKILGGLGYEATILFEKARYKDLMTKKKVDRLGVTLILPKNDDSELENKEILEAIDHYCKELISYKQSRFEIAKRLLFPSPQTEN